MAKVPVKLTKKEMVIPPEVVAKHREDLEAMNNIGLMYRARGGEVDWDRQRFFRLLLESGKLSPREEALILRKLGITPDRKEDGGLVAKVKKVYKEGYTAPGQAYAIAKSMGYQEGGEVDPRLGQLGQSLVSIGQRDFKGASDALVAKGPDKAAEKELKSEKERADAYKASIDAASKAQKYVDAGANKVLDYRSQNFAQLLAGFDPTAWLQTGLDLVTGQRQEINTKLHLKFAGTPEWSAYDLFDQEVKLLELKARSLVKGGSISDSEAAAAAKTILTPTANAATVKQQLATVIDRNNKGLTNLGEPEYVSEAQIHTPTGTSKVTEDPVVETDSLISTGEEVVDTLGDAATTAGDYIWSYTE